jgi:mannobiose 2-epimerase
MTVSDKLLDLRKRADQNARECIFPFWTSEYILDKENGGFYGKVTLDMEIVKDEPRSLVLTGWLFVNCWGRA